MEALPQSRENHAGSILALRLDMPDPNSVSHDIVKAAIDVHKELGPGLLESAYRTCLGWELMDRNVPFEGEVALPVMYKGRRINCGFRVDFIVEGLVVVEVKAVEAITPVHMAQVLTYLRLTGCCVGLILNFNSVRMKDGIKRLVHNLREDPRASSA